MRDDDEDEKKKPTAVEPPTPKVRHIQPVGMRVLVKVIPAEDRTPGGLFLPPGVSEKHQEALYAEVVEVARTQEGEDSLGENVSGIPAGAKVLFPREAGIAVPWDDSLRVLDTKDVLALVEEVPYEKTH